MLPARHHVRGGRRVADRRGARVVPPLLGVLRRHPGAGRRPARGDRARARRAPRHRGDRTRRRDALLHRHLPVPCGRVPRQAPQADADRGGAAGLGLRRRLDDAGARHAARAARRGDLLGELHAAAADGHVRQGHPDLVRADRRRARHLGRLDAPHRLRGPLLRAVGEPVRDARRLPGRLSARRRTGRGPLPRRLRDRLPARRRPGGTGDRRRGDPARRARPRPDRRGEVRLRRRRALRAARRLHPAGRRSARNTRPESASSRHQIG